MAFPIKQIGGESTSVVRLKWQLADHTLLCDPSSRANRFQDTIESQPLELDGIFDGILESISQEI